MTFETYTGMTKGEFALTLIVGIPGAVALIAFIGYAITLYMHDNVSGYIPGH